MGWERTRAVFTAVVDAPEVERDLIAPQREHPDDLVHAGSRSEVVIDLRDPVEGFLPGARFVRSDEELLGAGLLPPTLEMDIDCIAIWSVATDLKLMTRMLSAVIDGEGAY